MGSAAISASSLAEALDQELGRAEAHARDLEQHAERQLAAATAEREQIEAASTRVSEMAGQLRILRPRSAEVSRLYDQVVDELGRARPALDAALRRWRSPSTVPAFEPRFDPTGLDVPGLQDRLRRLGDLRREAEVRRLSLVADEREARRASVEGWGSITDRLNGLRIDLIDKLPRERRRTLLGLSRDGISQLSREVEQLKLSARLYRARRAGQLDRLPDRLRDVFAVGSASWTLLKFLAPLALFIYLRRRRSAIRSGAHSAVKRLFATPSGQVRGRMLVRILEVVAPWGAVLALIAALRWALGPLAQIGELDLPLRIATLYAVYRLAIDVLFASTMGIARRYRLSLDEQRTAEVLRSVRTMMRVVVGIIVLLTLAERFVGRGYLYFLVLRFAWIFVLGAALVLLVRWRRAIADAYVGISGGGRLAAIVRRARDRWYGVFVSAGAFVLLAGHAALQVGRDFAMGFDQTRRALAFVFRRRVQKRAEVRGYAEGDIARLPPAVVQAFAEDPVSGPAAIDHFPGLDRLEALRGPWMEDDVGASFLLVGEKGMGKTSWLQRIEGNGVPVDHVVLAHRVRSESQLARALWKELGLPADEDAGLAALHKLLAAGPKRIVTVDLAQNLFLAKVGGYDTFESFVALVDATCDRVYWVCAISAFAWNHLEAVRPDLTVFRDRQRLPAWTEEQIGDMLRTRTAAAGVEVVYDDLLLDPRRAGDRALQTETAEQYIRLLWDYADGNPRAALHFWLRSLVPESERRLRVRLFRAPASTELDAIGDRGRFLLAGLVVHENLSLQEASEVTRYPRAVCRLQLERLHDGGIVQRAQGRYRLTSHWHRAVVRSLRRGNLLSD